MNRDRIKEINEVMVNSVNKVKSIKSQTKKGLYQEIEGYNEDVILYYFDKKVIIIEKSYPQTNTSFKLYYSKDDDSPIYRFDKSLEITRTTDGTIVKSHYKNNDISWYNKKTKETRFISYKNNMEIVKFDYARLKVYRVEVDKDTGEVYVLLRGKLISLEDILDTLFKLEEFANKMKTKVDNLFEKFKFFGDN